MSRIIGGLLTLALALIFRGVAIASDAPDTPKAACRIEITGAVTGIKSSLKTTEAGEALATSSTIHIKVASYRSSTGGKANPRELRWVKIPLNITDPTEKDMMDTARAAYVRRSGILMEFETPVAEDCDEKTWRSKKNHIMTATVIHRLETVE